MLILQYVLFGQKEYLVYLGKIKSNQLIEDVFLIQTICDTEKLTENSTGFTEAVKVSVRL